MAFWGKVPHIRRTVGKESQALDGFAVDIGHYMVRDDWVLGPF